MSAAHWGAMLKRMRLAHVFSNASGLSITLTICLLAEIHKHPHMKKAYSACTQRIICICTFLPHWMIKVLEGSLIILNVTCKATAVAVVVVGGGQIGKKETGRLLFMVMVYLPNVKP